MDAFFQNKKVANIDGGTTKGMGKIAQSGFQSGKLFRGVWDLVEQLADQYFKLRKNFFTLDIVGGKQKFKPCERTNSSLDERV